MTLHVDTMTALVDLMPIGERIGGVLAGFMRPLPNVVLSLVGPVRLLLVQSPSTTATSKSNPMETKGNNRTGESFLLLYECAWADSTLVATTHSGHSDRSVALTQL
jgi:hypothetical protein